MDAAVHMALGGKVHDGARPVLREQRVEQRAVADVALHETVAGIALERSQALRVTRVRQGIEVQHRLAGCGDPVENEVGANEPGAACDENHGGSRRTIAGF
jgi:hypothetical protein